jgi:nucleoside-diphosphate-sugar epimerase
MIQTEEQLDDFLSAPSEADIGAMSRLEGDLVVLGAGGKMGPSLVRRAKRAAEAAGSRAKIIAVTRSTPVGVEGVENVAADLLDREAVQRLPDAANVIYMVGRKFGSTGQEELTWAVNALASAWAAERYRGSRIVAFSTGNVYPLVPIGSSGAMESTPPAPIGEYAQSALARERIFQYYSGLNGTPMLMLRLNYAVELRYGVLVDIAQKVLGRKPVNLEMGYVNVIWQGDANSAALRSLELCQSPPRVLNLTGPECLPVRRLAEDFGRHFGIQPAFEGVESPTALLSDASLYHRLLGRPSVGVAEMIERIAVWLESGGRMLGKPTHFETRTGKF